MRKFSKGVTGVVMAGALLFMGGNSAFAVDYVAESVEGLSKDNIHIDSQVNLNKSSEIESAFNGSTVAIVSLPEGAVSSLSSNFIASEVASRTNDSFDLVIVSVDQNKDSYGAYSNDSEVVAEALTILNSKNTGDAGETISQNSNELLKLVTTTQNATSNSESDSNALVPVGGAAVGVVVLASIVFFVIKRNKPKTRTSNNQISPEDVFKDSLSNMAVQYKQLVSLKVKNRNIYEQTNLIGGINSLLNNTLELFERIEKNSTKQKAQMTSMHYEDILKKLNKALDDNYYVDIVENPNFWDESERRKAEVVQAVDAVNKELITNIRQVNASRDLEFQVALDMLTKAVENNNNHKEIFGKGD